MNITKIASLALASSLLAGCSNLQTEFDKQKKIIKQQRVVIQELNETNSFLKTDNLSLRTKLKEADASGAHNSNLSDLNKKYNTKLEEMIASISAQLDGASGISGISTGTTATGQPFLRMENKVVFKPGSATLSRTGQSVLSKVLNILEKYPDKYFRIDGHTDTDPIRVAKSFSSNWDLSAARATNVVEYLTKKSSLDSGRFYIAAFGPYSPVSSTSDKAANRRVEIIITDGK